METPLNHLPPVDHHPENLVRRARLGLVLAAVLWSLSGAFTRVMTTDTSSVIGFSAHEPAMSPLAMAFWRVFWGGAILLPFVKPSQIRLGWRMVPVGLAFAFMNTTIVAALALGSSANAIMVQNTAPFWVVLIGWAFWRDKPDRATVASLALAMGGIACMMLEGHQNGQVAAFGLALASGVGFALVLMGLRWLKDLPSLQVTVFNFLTGTLVLLPVILFQGPPSARQLGIMALFGGFQMGLPYLITARSLKYIPAREAGLIALLEPLLNPVWTRLLAPESEPITLWKICGAVGILGALLARFWFAKNQDGLEVSKDTSVKTASL